MSRSKSKKIPYHLGLIPDGNRRWARQRDLPTLEGHKRGVNNFQDFCEWCQSRGIKILTAYGFSTENWNRSQQEIDYLMDLIEGQMRKMLEQERKKKESSEEGVRIKIIGQKKKLPKSFQQVIAQVEDLTKDNKKLQLNIALNYGGRWDIRQAIDKVVKERPREGQGLEQKVTEQLVKEHLTVQSYPDLIIRTGKVKRLSNFLTWQSAYSELYFCDKYWPEFTEQDLDKALKDYAQRQRRFGGDQAP